eukprot:364119-Chlamydomonas_euryale.AAC.2
MGCMRAQRACGGQGGEWRKHVCVRLPLAGMVGKCVCEHLEGIQGRHMRTCIRRGYVCEGAWNAVSKYDPDVWALRHGLTSAAHAVLLCGPTARRHPSHPWSLLCCAVTWPLQTA